MSRLSSSCKTFKPTPLAFLSVVTTVRSVVPLKPRFTVLFKVAGPSSEFILDFSSFIFWKFSKINSYTLVRSAKFLLALIKNAQANAEVNGLDKDELFVKNIVIQQAPKMRWVFDSRK